MNNRNTTDKNQLLPQMGTMRHPISGQSGGSNGRPRAGYMAHPTGVANSSTGPIKYTRPKATPETTSIGAPKVSLAADPPRIRRSMAGTFTTRKPLERIKHTNAGAGPSNAIRRGSPSLPFRQSHTYARKGLQSLVHKHPTNKHGNRKTLGSSMNVILPPQNIHSLTGSVMESQMFPRNNGRHSEYSTFRVEIEQNPIPEGILSFKEDKTNNNNCFDINYPEGKHITTPLLQDFQGKHLLDLPIEDQYYLTPEILQVERELMLDGSHNTKVTIIDEKNSPDELQLINLSVEDATLLNMSDKDKDNKIALVEHSKFHDKSESPRSIFETDLDIISNYFGNLMRTDYITPPAQHKHPQTAPVTTKSYYPAASPKNQKHKAEKKAKERGLSSTSQTILTELAFLQGMRSDSCLDNLRESLPPKPKTAQPVLPILTETELLKAALQESINSSNNNEEKSLQLNGLLLDEIKSMEETDYENRHNYLRSSNCATHRKNPGQNM